MSNVIDFSTVLRAKLNKLYEQRQKPLEFILDITALGHDGQIIHSISPYTRVDEDGNILGMFLLSTQPIEVEWTDKPWVDYALHLVDIEGFSMQVDEVDGEDFGIELRPLEHEAIAVLIISLDPQEEHLFKVT